MPIREYKCKDCGDYIEVIQGIHEKPLEECLKCGGKLEKLISNTSFQLKGTGWYKTDYGSQGKTNNKKVKSESNAASPAGSDSGSNATSSCACSGNCCHSNKS